MYRHLSSLKFPLFSVHSDPSLQVRACNLLGGYLTHKETNMRYLALESLSHLATSDLSREAVKKHQDTVLEQLKVIISFMWVGVVWAELVVVGPSHSFIHVWVNSSI